MNVKVIVKQAECARKNRQVVMGLALKLIQH